MNRRRRFVLRGKGLLHGNENHYNEAPHPCARTRSRSVLQQFSLHWPPKFEPKRFVMVNSLSQFPYGSSTFFHSSLAGLIGDKKKKPGRTERHAPLPWPACFGLCALAQFRVG